MTISYIVPLYNGAVFIESCLQSIINQNITDVEFEIIVVDDGSTDNGSELVERFADLHSNVRLINQSNQGVGAARNRGIEEARGDYLIFIDADDALLPGGTVKILDEFKKYEDSPDIIIFDRYFVKQKSNQKLEPLTTNVYFQGNVKDYALRHGIKAFVTSYFFRKEVVQDIRFNDFKVGEDLCFMLNVFNKTKLNIIALDTKLYLYYVNSESAVHKRTKDGVRRLITNYLEMYKSVLSGLKMCNYTLIERKRLVCYDINYFCFAQLLSAPFSLSETRKILQECSEYSMFDFENLNSTFFKTLRFIARHPFLCWSISPLYRYIYIPFFKKG